MTPAAERRAGMDEGAVLAASHAALDRRDWTGAALGYLDVLARQPENIEARAGIGTCFLEVGASPEGLARLGDPARLLAVANIIRELAYALAYSGRTAEAECLLESLLVLAPGQEPGRVAQGRLGAFFGGSSRRHARGA